MYDYEKAAEAIADFIRAKVKEKEAKGLFIGISGGLDSAVLAFLGVKALGSDKVHGLFLPDRDTDPVSYYHANLVAETAGISLKNNDLTAALAEMGCYRNIIVKVARNRVINRLGIQIFRSLSGKDLYALNLTGSDNRIVKQAVQSYYLRDRLRMQTLYEEAKNGKLLFPDSFNKTEDLIGFASYGSYSDISVDVAPILPLYKSQVRNLATTLDVPREIIIKPPSPDLFPGITDEIFIGLAYEQLDCILFALELDIPIKQIALQCGVREKEVLRVKHLKDLSSQLGSGIGMPCPDLTMAKAN